jgi:tetratricopeptide (TPR) repeat protein
MSEGESMERLEASERWAMDEQLKAPILYAELLARPSAERMTVVRNSRRFNSYLLAEMLLEKSRESWFDDPAQALEAAELAVEVATRLEASFYDETLLRAVKSRTLAYLANVRRILSDFPGALECFQKIEDLLADTALAPTEWAEIMSLRFSLYVSMKQYQEAGALLDQIIEVYKEAEDSHQVGRALLQKGRLLALDNQVEASIGVLQEGLPLIDARREPRMIAVGLQNLAMSFEETGRYQEALETMNKARPLFLKQGDRLIVARLRWAEGRILAALGQLAEAEKAYVEVRKIFAERGVEYEQAMVCLDLALLYTEQERTDRVRQLAVEMLPIFRSFRLSQEVLAALVLFQHAAEREIATLGLIREIVGYLRRAEAVGAPGES